LFSLVLQAAEGVDFVVQLDNNALICIQPYHTTGSFSLLYALVEPAEIGVMHSSFFFGGDFDPYDLAEFFTNPVSTRRMHDVFFAGTRTLLDDTAFLLCRTDPVPAAGHPRSRRLLR
jgi:hypothetical protein